MSDPEKPLHVRVAEALGWTDIRPCGNIAAPWASFHKGHPPGYLPIIGESGHVLISRYDIEWSATGPLIEKYKIDLWFLRSLFGNPDEWRASNYLAEHAGVGPTPLIAICELLLKLAEAGKLNA